MKVNNWISVEDRLPENGNGVLVSRYNKKLKFSTTNVDNYMGYGNWWNRDYDNEVWQITHWMPLPEDPQIQQCSNINYPDDMDKECIPLCNLFNSIGLTTQFSCCGHGESRFQIIFADNITDEQIYPFIERLSQTCSYTPIIGGFLKWTRKVDDKIVSNWTYQVDKIEWADCDLNSIKEHIGGVE